MSDCKQCNPPDRKTPTFREAQDELHIQADILDHLCGQIETFCRALPEASQGFAPLAEVRAAMDCVRKDLLVDAVETLRRAAGITEEELEKRFEERQEWQLVVM